MGECLVTKLQEVVDKELPKLGVATWELPANVTEYNLRLGNYRGQKLTWNGGVIVKDYKNNVLTSPYLVDASATLNNMVKVSSGATGGIMELKSKYAYNDSVGSTSEGLLYPLKYENNLKSISYWFSGKWFSCIPFGDVTINSNPITGNIEDIVDCLERNDIIVLSFSNCPNLEGSIDLLGGLSNCTYINISRNSKITGNIANLGGWTSVTTLLFYGTPGITGSIESFVAAQRSAGRTTASGIRVNGSSLTYNGASIGSSDRTLSWTADSISLV